MSARKPVGSDTKAAMDAHQTLLRWASLIDNDGALMDIFAAVEALCDEANAGARQCGLIHAGADGNGRLDVLEEHRNSALRGLLNLRNECSEVRHALRDLAHKPMARKEIAPLFIADSRGEAAQ